MSEKTMADAPVWYNAAQADAWASGYNSCLTDALAQQPSMRDHIISALDSPTVAAIARVFDPRYQRVDQSYSEQIASILEASFATRQPFGQIPASKFSPGDPVEVRKIDDQIDEIVIRRGDVHIEQMSNDSWFMGIDASDGSYWQFWFGAKNRKSHVAFTHCETVPAGDNLAPPVGVACAPSAAQESNISDYGNSPREIQRRALHVVSSPHIPGYHADEPELVRLAKSLAGAELNYRNSHDLKGGGHIETGRKWDLMRRAGDAIRKYFYDREEAPAQDGAR